MFIPDEVSFYTIRSRHCVENGDYKKALEYGRKSSQTNVELSSLRICSLYRLGQLGTCLFEFPLDRDDRIFSMIPKDDIQRKLCGFLVEKDLDSFINLLSENYSLSPRSLPKHYREALVYYIHHCSSPKVDYKDNLFEADYADYQRMEKECVNYRVRKNTLQSFYGTTYWYYSDYLFE
jgi:hypothetical protein